MLRLFLSSFCYLFLINVSAQTGIGTTAPINKFQVETAAAAPLTSGTGFNGHLRLGVTGANQILDFGLGTTYGWIQSRDKTGYGTNYILALNPNGGNVGIGTTVPAATLDVNGNITNSSYTGTFSGFSANLNSPNSSTTSYTILSSDNGKIINFTGSSAITVTIPAGLSTGFNCMVIQNGQGQIGFTNASGVTINNRSGYTKTAGQFSIVTIVHLGNNIYITSGEMSN